MQGAGGVGGDEFHLHPAPLTHVAMPVGMAGGENIADHLGGCRFVEEEVDKAGAGDFGPGHLSGGGQGVDNQLGDLTRWPPGGFGQGQGDVAGQIAVALVLGAVDIDPGFDVRRQLAAVGEGLQGRAYQVADMVFHGCWSPQNGYSNRASIIQILRRGSQPCGLSGGGGRPCRAAAPVLRPGGVA